ncbi:MAG TPA: hypothetical protein PKB14_17640 [Rubrivivax sp.]|nr:hypothetical protein [Rubrivivax sp.]
MGELGDSLERMGFMQLLALFGFVTCYMLALGGLFGSAVRLRAALAALAQAVAFVALTEPWVHGALLIAFVVAGLGLFVVLSWLLARTLGPRQPLALAAESASDNVDTSAPQTSGFGDGRAPAPKLVRRARAAR